MLRYFINSLLICLPMILSAQITGDSIQLPVDYKEKYGLRVGIDLSKPLRSTLDENYQGLELVADFRISQKWYIAGELGTEEKTTLEDTYDFTTSGSYLKIGADWNMYDNWYGMQNIINLGLRAGISTFSQTLNEYSIYTTNQYWQENTGTSDNTRLLGEYDGLSAQWAEVVVGVKVELFTNLFLGGSVRLHYLVNQTEASEFPNLYIPGFNKVTDDSRFGVGYNYTLSYLIPIFKKDKPPKKDENTPQS
ncbi:DUF6048 family protein [Robertkochia aurantiaca]|uniref:DUF6048 family protein n=1 Tax=Robertkochia aurantiaca TaxID=2873700 RepID=UPI001CCC335B|nr:DUF6048 family protein [Robertkochia sp. 3YJGBD-33]